MSKTKFESWILPLEGHQFDLENLTHWLKDQNVYVAAQDDGFVLVIPTAVIGDDYKPVNEFAKGQLEMINGIGSLLDSEYRPVYLTGSLHGIDSAGAKIQTIASIGTAELRIKGHPVTLIVAGKVQPDPRKLAALPLLKASAISMQAHDALVISGRPILTWPELYLLFELVESDVGSKMIELGWISKSKKKQFEHTANSYSTLRSQGRHGKDKGSTPPKPMKLNDATSLVKGLVVSWLNYLGNSIDTPDAG